MQRLTARLLVTATLATAVSAQRGGRGRGGAARAPELDHFTFDQGVFETDLQQGGEARYFVLLPKGHDDEANKDKTYPWILWLPGFGGPMDFLHRGGADLLDHLRGKDEIPELALVVFASRRSVYMNGERAGRTEDLLTGALLEHLQQKYRLSDKREQRAIMGMSAGGFGALKIALRHPDLFAAVGAHSAAILPADPKDLAGFMEDRVQRMLGSGIDEELGNPIDPKKWAAHMPMAIAAAKKPAELQGLQIYLGAGTEDHYDFFEPNRQLAAALTANGHEFVFQAVENGGHAWSSPEIVESVAVSLRFAGEALAGKDAVKATKARLAEAAGQKKDGDEKGGEDK